MTTVPSVHYNVAQAVADALVGYFNNEDVHAFIKSSFSDYISEDYIVVDGHDSTIVHFPHIIIESTGEDDDRTAVGVITQTQSFNIIPEVRRTGHVESEKVIRAFASAVKQALYHMINLDVTIGNQTYTTWDINKPGSVQYGYRQAKTLRAALIPWSLKIDVPLSALYVDGNNI